MYSVVDSHHLDEDPDSTYHPDADPYADPDPTFHPDVDPDPENSLKKRLKPMVADPDWIRIQSGLWIRIRNPDPDPGGQK
jgi:hypothetical protein